MNIDPGLVQALMQLMQQQGGGGAGSPATGISPPTGSPSVALGNQSVSALPPQTPSMGGGGGSMTPIALGTGMQAPTTPPVQVGTEGAAPPSMMGGAPQAAIGNQMAGGPSIQVGGSGSSAGGGGFLSRMRDFGDRRQQAMLKALSGSSFGSY